MVGLASLLTVAVGIPAFGVLTLVATGVAKHPEVWGQWSGLGASTIGPTVVYALVIAAFSTLLGVPGAWVLARCHGRATGLWLALILNPILLPSYLPYAGWGLVRGPGTWMGDWLARGNPSWSVWAGHLAALLGMVLWAWPLPALIISRRVAGLDFGTIDCTQLDVRSRFVRVLMLVRLLRGSLITSLLAVGLVVLGSAIPLHVAQVPTYTIELWKAMQLTTEMLPTWMAASPLLLMAAAAGIAAARWGGWRSATTIQSRSGRPASRAMRAGTLIVWTLSVLAPLSLFFASVRSWGSLPAFWTISGAGVAQSGQIGAVVGLLGAALCVGTWRLAGSGRSTACAAAGVSTGIWVFAGLVPGVLVGQAVAGAFAGIRWMEAAIVPLTHLARFGWLAALLGCYLAKQEPQEEGWLKHLDGGGWRTWWQTSLVGNFRVLLGMAIALVVLSINEIESTIFVQPPGLSNLAQQLLDYLHYARDEQLSAAAVNLLGLGLVATLLAGWLLGGLGPKVQRASHE